MRRRTPQTLLSIELRRCFSQQVRFYRTQRGMTQEELGHAAGLARTFVNKIERKQMSVTIETIAALAGALQVAPSALIAAEDAHQRRAVSDRVRPSASRQVPLTH